MLSVGIRGGAYARERHRRTALRSSIRRLVESGRFTDESEVVPAGLRLREDFEEERQRRYDDVMDKIEEGFRSAEEEGTIPADEVFSELQTMIERDTRKDAAEWGFASRDPRDRTSSPSIGISETSIPPLRHESSPI